MAKAAQATPRRCRSSRPWTRRVSTSASIEPSAAFLIHLWVRYGCAVDILVVRRTVLDKCSELLRMADDAAVTLRNEYAIQLLKLPKKVGPCAG